MRRSRGDIWFVDLTDTRGHEQSGLRPAVVLAIAYESITIVVPLTTAPAVGRPSTIRRLRMRSRVQFPSGPERIGEITRGLEGTLHHSGNVYVSYPHFWERL